MKTLTKNLTSKAVIGIGGFALAAAIDLIIYRAHETRLRDRQDKDLYERSTRMFMDGWNAGTAEVYRMTYPYLDVEAYEKIYGLHPFNVK